MSRASRGREPRSLPLFPLRTVLFPGGLLPLKVFEQRYVEMTKACMRDDAPFGVCLITQGEEVATPDGASPEFAAIGTLARITNFDMPQLGILHLQTQGLDRFQVQSHRVDGSGLVVGMVTSIAEEPQHPLSDAYAPLARVLELIAARIGAPSAVRPVAQALRWNPLPIVIPCHRVIGSSGDLTGYSGNKVGLKQRLLTLEGVPVTGHRHLQIERPAMYARYQAGDEYCLPSCGDIGTMPMADVTLFGSRDRAEDAGLLPCSSCRPDLHPLEA